MKKILFILIISSLFLFGGMSCNENEEFDATVTFNFELQNQVGEATTVFHEGENIFMSLKVTNTTDEDLSLDPAIHYQNIIQLFKITEEGESFLGNFYENGQLTNEYRQTIFTESTFTEIIYPWVWYEDVQAELIMRKTNELEEKKVSPINNTYEAPNNSYPAIGSYVVKLNIPKEWGIEFAKEETRIEFEVI